MNLCWNCRKPIVDPIKGINTYCAHCGATVKEGK
jgi:exosome complex RNA-binding protein Csl4